VSAAMSEDEESPPTFRFAADWVEQILAKTYIRRDGQDVRWCPRWWAHPEAAIRLGALWQTWEVAVADDGQYGMANWLRDYLDRLLPPLLSPAGPFAACSRRGHLDQEPMPAEPAPAGSWCPPALAPVFPEVSD